MNIEISNFESWLKALNYAQSTIYNSTKQVKDFLDYINQYDQIKTENISKQQINSYLKHLQIRPSKKQSGALSTNYIISNIGSLRRFSKFLRETRQINLEIPREIKPQTETRIILTKQEISLLYNACENTILGTRDRIILDLYYGCGLRRNEGVQLNTEDIYLQKNLIHIKKAKGSKERLIPINQQITKNLENYLLRIRPNLIKNTKEKALILSIRGTRLNGSTIQERFKKFTNLLPPNSLHSKKLTLHTLRHSIATHLLQSGMSLEQISNFLGHSTLETTQIYTHLAHELF